jgi:hypothetical protein
MLSGLFTQTLYHRSISMSSLWHLGFGVPNENEITSWGQPTYVSPETYSMNPNIC